MDKFLVLSILIFLFISFNFIKIIRAEVLPKDKKIKAAFFYGICIVGLIIINIMI